MGRIFETRKVKMFARWAKTAKAFTKMGKEIAIAVKLAGPEPAGNPRLKAAINMARGLNMPKDRIEAAIQRAAGKEEMELVELVYEAHGPHGVAMMIESATDNPTRTAGNLRSYFGKYGGSMGTTGSLSYLFERKGLIKVAPDSISEELELELIDAGLQDLYAVEDGLMVSTSFNDFAGMQKLLESKGIPVLNASAQRIPNSHATLTPAQRAEADKLIEVIEEDDDVQHVFHNIGE